MFSQHFIRHLLIIFFTYVYPQTLLKMFFRIFWNHLIVSEDFLRPAIHLSQNMRKQLQNAKKQKVYSGVLRVTFLFRVPFFTFHISQHFLPGLTFVWKVKRFCGLFFRSINKTRNSHEIRKMYSRPNKFPKTSSKYWRNFIQKFLNFFLKFSENFIWNLGKFYIIFTQIFLWLYSKF